MADYYCKEQIRKIYNSIETYKNKHEFDKKINIKEHVSKFINNYLDLAFHIMEVREYFTNYDINGICDRVVNLINRIRRLSTTINNNDNIDEEQNNEYIKDYFEYVEDIIFTLDPLLNRIRYPSREIQGVRFNDIIFDETFESLLSKLRNTNTYSFLDVSDGGVRTKFESIFTNETYSNINYYVWRKDLDNYNRIKNVSYRFIAGSPNTCKISNNVFDIVYCSPKYTNYMDNTILENSEKVYIRNAIKYAKPNGIIILEYSKCRLTKDTSSLIAKFIGNINIIEDENSDKILIIGNKRKEKVLDQEEYNRLRRFCNKNNELIKDTLDNIYISSVFYEIALFKGTMFSDAMKDTILSDSKIVDSFFEKNAISSNKEERHPLLPFSIGQLGLVLTSGCLNGIITEYAGESNTEFYHVIKGSVVKETEKSVTIDFENPSNKITEEIIGNKVNINIITPTGNILKLA